MSTPTRETLAARLSDIAFEAWRKARFPHHDRHTFLTYFLDLDAEGWAEVREDWDAVKVALHAVEQARQAADALDATCQTCRHWSVYTDHTGKPMSFGDCLNSIRQMEHGSTAPDFGCRLHQPAPAPPAREGQA